MRPNLDTKYQILKSLCILNASNRIYFIYNIICFYTFYYIHESVAHQSWIFKNEEYFLFAKDKLYYKNKYYDVEVNLTIYWVNILSNYQLIFF